MNLPRHSITSHAITPIFNNAHFTLIEQEDDDNDDDSNIYQRFKNRSAQQRIGSKSKSSQFSARSSNEIQRPLKKPDQISSGIGSNDQSEEKQNEKFFACATNQGFFVAKVEPFRMVVSRQFPVLQGGLSHVALIDDSSLMVLVGGGRVPRFAPNKVILWDENLTYKIPLSSKRNPINLDTDDFLSEGTASPPPSTIFSLGREQNDTETIAGDVDDEERMVNVEEYDTESTYEALQRSELSNESTSNDSILSTKKDESKSDEPNQTVENTKEDSMSSSMNDNNSSEKADGVEEKEEEVEPISASISIDRSISGSLMASSANMDDPFGAPLSPSNDVEDEEVKDEALGESIKEDNEFEKEELEQNEPYAEQAEEAEQQFRVERGREVAELEFGEAVQSIRVESFVVRGWGLDDETNDSNEEEDEEDRDSTKQGKVALLIVTLQTKAIIFELGTHFAKDTNEKVQENRSNPSSWNIRQRLILDIHPDSSRCSPAIAQIEKSNCALIALPGRQIGHVQLVCVEFSHTGRTTLFPSIAGASTIIAAHTNSIACLQLSKDGHYLCTASERGTLLRLWSTFPGLGKENRTSTNPNNKNSSSSFRRGSDRITTMAAALMGELRRGSESARILSIALTPDKRFLAVASDKGTIHFFDLTALQGSLPFASMGGSGSIQSSKVDENTSKNSLRFQQSSQTGIKFSQQANKYLPTAIQNFAQQIPTSLLPQYFKSQWSFAQFRINLQIFSGRMNESMRYVKAPERKKNFVGKPFVDNDEMDDEKEGLRKESPSFIGDAFVPDRERNLEGGWAKMRGRVSDIRKGERTIQESIWLTWVPSKVDKDHKSTEKNEEPFQLIAITSSGSLYRLAVNTISSLNVKSQLDRHNDHSSSSSSSNPSSSTILDMYRNDHSSSSDRQSSDEHGSGTCSLIEHIRFGKRDEWLD